MRRLTLLLFFAALAAVTVYAVFYPTNAAEEPPTIRYPQTIGEEPDPMVDIIGSNRRLMEEVTIDADNGQQVLAMLMRPNEYMASYAIAYHLGEDKIADLTIQLWVTPDIQKVIQQSSDWGGDKITLLTKENVYIRDIAGKDEYIGKAGEFTVDDVGHILTHENLLRLEKDYILSAQILPSAQDQSPCLVIEAINPLSGYREVYTIPAATGLLLSCRVYDQERCIYEMTQTALSTETIKREEVFILPGGEVVR